jgi:hypothetical protein
VVEANAGTADAFVTPALTKSPRCASLETTFVSVEQHGGPLAAEPPVPLAQAVRVERRRDLVRFLPEQSRHDQPLRRSLEQPRDVEQQRPHEVGDHGRRLRRRLAPQVHAPHLDRAPLRRAFSADASSEAGSTSTASTGSYPSRAAAIASTPLPEPQSASGPPGRARAAARGTAASCGARRSRTPGRDR